MVRKQVMSGSHSINEPVTHTHFDNADARQITDGDTIVERDAKGRITRKAEVTDVLRYPPSCPNRLHVSVKFNAAFGGIAHAEWCYDNGARVEIQ